MDERLPPNKFGSQTGTLDPSSTGYDREQEGGTGTMRARRTAEVSA